jgi:hypothetical protein
MTLFIRTPNRQYEISDFYVMVLCFIISYWTGRILRKVIQKLIKKQKTLDVKTPPRGGATLEFSYSDDQELAKTILACIADNTDYLVKNQKIKELIFHLVKQKIKNESLVLTPNMIRLLAKKIVNDEVSWSASIGNIVVSTNYQKRLSLRTLGRIIFGGVIGVTATSIRVGVFFLILYFFETDHCYYKCEDHFEKLPPNDPIEILAEQQTGNIIISENNDAHQVQIYVPSKPEKTIVKTNQKTGEKIVSRTYKAARKKAKQVNFSDFRKTDPVLQMYDKVPEPEPYVPQRKCLVDPIEINKAIEEQIN